MTLQEQIRANRLRSVITVAGFFLLVAIVAGAIGLALDLTIGGFALAGALVYTAFALANSRRMVASMTGAHELPPDAMRGLRRLVENVSIAAGLPVTPEVRVVDDPAPNAFATGLRPEKSFVGVTTGLLRTMPKRELEAVLAHEVAHIRNRDTYLMTMAAVFVGVIAFIADIGFRSLAWGGGRRKGGVIVIVAAVIGFLLAPYAAMLLRLALSRRREFLADGTAAEILGDPEAMALALRRLEQRSDPCRPRRRLRGAPLDREPDRPGRDRAEGRARALEHVQHPPVDRVAHRGARAGRRLQAAGDRCRPTSRSSPTKAEL